VGNNRFSADAFVVAGAGHATDAPDGTARRGPDLERALDRLEACPSDNGAVRCLESAGFRSRDLADHPWSRFDVDTPLDLALLRLATRLPGTRRVDESIAGYLEMARLPGGAELAALGDAVILDTRVLMAALGGSAEIDAWPPAEERFASDFSDPAPIRTPWLREMVEEARGARIPFLFGGHSLVSDGLRLMLAAAWLGR